MRKTNDRLLTDAMKAAAEWQRDAKTYKETALLHWDLLLGAQNMFPWFFLAGVLIGGGGLLIISSLI